MHIKRSHLEAIKFIFGTLFTCICILSFISHPRTRTLQRAVMGEIAARASEAKIAHALKITAENPDGGRWVAVQEHSAPTSFGGALVSAPAAMLEDGFSEFDQEAKDQNKSLQVPAVAPAPSDEDGEEIQALLNQIEVAKLMSAQKFVCSSPVASRLIAQAN